MDHIRANVAAALKDPEGGIVAVKQICNGCLELLPVDGVSISVIGDLQYRETLFASDGVVSKIESLQFTLGEGPCFEAFNTRRPVLVSDLAEASASSWPVFASEVSKLPVGAIFAFPVQWGAISIGAIDLYRQQPGWLSEQDLKTALELVDLVGIALLGSDETGATFEEWLPYLPRNREEVHQATGILVAKFGISAEQALSRLRAYAFRTGDLIEDIAHDIALRRIDLDELET